MKMPFYMYNISKVFKENDVFWLMNLDPAFYFSYVTKCTL